MLNKRKTTAAVVAGVTAAALVLGGTFAWINISQQAKNETVVDINPGGRLHDDFNGRNKDVYVENFGDELTGVPIYARIKLSEYMEIGPDAGINKDSTTGRQIEVVMPDNWTDTNPTPDINDEKTWITYIPGDSITTNDPVMNKDREFGTYWDWALGNDDTNLPYYMPTFNKNKDSLAADINGTYEGLVTGDGVHYDDYKEYAATDSVTADATYDWDENDDEEVNPTVTRNENDPRDSANILKKEEEHTAAPISSTANVILMADWLALPEEEQVGPYWVYDTDGWAYWAQAIEPGETTGLLLDEINMTRTPDDNWYYGLNVEGQFATAGDWDVFFDAAAGEMTPEGEYLMRLLTVEKTIHALLLDNGDSATYSLAFLETRDDFEVGEIYTGPGLTTFAATTGLAVVEEFENVGWLEQPVNVNAPWHDYADSITTVSFDTVVQPVSTTCWFYRMSNLTTINGMENLDTSKTVTMTSMFSRCTSLTTLDVSGLVTSSAKVLDSIFFNCTGLTSITGLDTWDTSNVTTLRNVFYACSSLTDLSDISGWTTSKVENMASMFQGCTALTLLDLTGWKTGNVTNMSSMFSMSTSNTAVHTNLTSVGDLSGWDTSKVTTMYEIFINCDGLTDEDFAGVSGWDLGNVVDMQGMFAYCAGVTSIDVSTWDTSSAKSTWGTFHGCTSLATITGVGNWDVSNVEIARNMFIDCPITSLDLSKWKTDSLRDMEYMFAGCTALETVGDISNWNTSNVVSMRSTFQTCTSLKGINVSNWDTSKVTNISHMFYECSSLTDTGLVGIGNFDVSNVTTMLRLFDGCTSLTKLDLSGWAEKTGKTETILGMFYRCAELTEINLTGWDMSKVTNMAGAFHGCNSLTTIAGIENWDVSGLQVSHNMFWDCTSLTTLDLSNWADKVGNVTDMNNMFQNCTALTTITGIENWDVSNAVSMGNMFANCAQLNLNLSGWDVSKVTTYTNFNLNATGVTAPTWVN